MAFNIGANTIIDNNRVLGNLTRFDPSVKLLVAGEAAASFTYSPADSSSVTIPLSTNATGSTVYKVTITKNTQITFSNLPTFGSGIDTFSFTLVTTNNGTAGSALSFTNTIKWAGGFLPARTTSANAVDIWTFFIDNGTIYGTLAIADGK